MNDETSLKDIILKFKDWTLYLFAKWYFIALFGIIGGLTGYYIAKSKPPIFTASSTFVLEGNEQGGLSQYAGIASMMGINLGGMGGGIFQGDNLLELYRSRLMIESTLLTKSSTDSSLILLDYYILMNDLKKRWEKVNPGLLSIDFHEGINTTDIVKRSRDSILSEIVNDINKNYLLVGKPDKKLSIVRVDVKSKDEKFSKEFNEALVKRVNDFFIQTKIKKSSDNVEILQAKVDSVRSVMNGAIYSAAKAIDNTPNLNPTKQEQRIVPTQRSQFSAETNKTILAQLVQNLELAKMSLLQEVPLIQVIDSPIYPIKKEVFGKLKGLIFGVVLGAAITVFFLILIRMYKNIMN